MRPIVFPPTFAGWQAAARAALVAGHPPEAIGWREAEDDAPAGLPDGSPARPPDAPTFRVPRTFVERARQVACHCDAARWELLYRIVWRLTHGEPRLLDARDADVERFAAMEQAVARELQRMRAGVRFHRVPGETPPWYVAWFEPEQRVLELNAPFFAERFASMRWSILTPERCAHWDGTALHLTPGVPRPAATDADAVVALWRQHHGERRSEEWHPATPPPAGDLSVLRDAAAACTACPLHARATQTVFGEGPQDASLVLVGEQPGDQEDLDGRPFVGPAGQLLDRALAAAGIDRTRCWVTNTVKHFKWEPRGRRRIHQTPTARDVAACRPWLDAELAILRPRLLVCLGATAARAVYGPAARVTRDRGVVRPSPLAPHTLITIHPSALLRAPDEATQREEYARFLADLQVAARFIGAAGPSAPNLT